MNVVNYFYRPQTIESCKHATKTLFNRGDRIRTCDLVLPKHVGERKRPPLSPREGWISDGRQVLYFKPVRYSRYSQALELTTGELIPGQAPLL